MLIISMLFFLLSFAALSNISPTRKAIVVLKIRYFLLQSRYFFLMFRGYCFFKISIFRLYFLALVSQIFVFFGNKMKTMYQLCNFKTKTYSQENKTSNNCCNDCVYHNYLLTPNAKAHPCAALSRIGVKQFVSTVFINIIHRRTEHDRDEKRNYHECRNYE